MRAEPIRVSRGVTATEHTGTAYDEEAFRYLLHVERSRAQRARRSVVLLLLKLQRDSRSENRIAPATASRLFEQLSVGLREIDLVGWYRAGRVIGAVLPMKNDEHCPSPETAGLIAKRLTAALQAQLPTAVACRIRMRAVILTGERGK